MSQLHIALLVGGALLLLVGLVSKPLKDRLFISEPLLALLLGVLIGPRVTGVMDPHSWPPLHPFMEEVARLTLAIGLMGVALRVPTAFLRGAVRPLLVVLLVVMPLMWLASGVVVLLVTGMPFWLAVLAGAIVTPTDPVAASSIVTGETATSRVPGRLRHLLSGESGFNDGLAYPLVYLGILFLTKRPETAVSEWLVRVVLWEVGAAVVAGALLGVLAGVALKWAERHATIENQSFIGYTLALSLLVVGLGKVIHSDGVLAVFVAGVAFGVIIRGKDRAEDANIQEAINFFFALPAFFLLGVALPWDDWAALGAVEAVVVAVAILLLRRPPVIFALAPLMSPVRGLGEKTYYGWFGPIGVSALFYAALAAGKLGGLEHARPLWAVSTLVICASVLAHGITATPLTKRLFPPHEAEREGDV